MVWTAYQQTPDEVLILGNVEAETMDLAFTEARRLYVCRRDATLGLARKTENIPNPGARRMSLGWRYVNTEGRKRLVAEGAPWL